MQYEKQWRPRSLFIERYDGAVWNGRRWSHARATRAWYASEENLPIKLPGGSEDAWWYLKPPRNDVYEAYGLGPCASVFEEDE